MFRGYSDPLAWKKELSNSLSRQRSVPSGDSVSAVITIVDRRDAYFETCLGSTELVLDKQANRQCKGPRRRLTGPLIEADRLQDGSRSHLGAQECLVPLQCV